jgi:hypothetical protein
VLLLDFTGFSDRTLPPGVLSVPDLMLDFTGFSGRKLPAALLVLLDFVGFVGFADI